MADTTRAAFPDPDRPLKTPDEDAQRLVAERLYKAYSDSTNNTSGERPPWRAYTVFMPTTNTVQGARQRVKDPGRLTRDETLLLCAALQVNLDYLRHGGTNGYGRYEDSERVGELYLELSDTDRELVCALILRLLGDARTREVRARWNAQLLEAAARTSPGMLDRARQQLGLPHLTDEQLIECVAGGNPLPVSLGTTPQDKQEPTS